MMHIVLNLPESRAIEPAELDRIAVAIPRVFRRRLWRLAAGQRLLCLGAWILAGVVAWLGVSSMKWSGDERLGYLLVVACIGSVMLGHLSAWWWHSRRIRALVREALVSRICFRCGHSLEGIPPDEQGTTCPECGQSDRRVRRDPAATAVEPQSA